MRDLILNVPVFWVQNPAYVPACLVTAVVMHFVAPRVESRYKAHLWFDGFGLALVTVAGTVKASTSERRPWSPSRWAPSPGLSEESFAIRWATSLRFSSVRRFTSRLRCSALAHMSASAASASTGGGDDRGVRGDVQRAGPGDQVRLVVASLPRIEKLERWKSDRKDAAARRPAGRYRRKKERRRKKEVSFSLPPFPSFLS